MASSSEVPHEPGLTETASISGLGLPRATLADAVSVLLGLLAGSPQPAVSQLRPGLATAGRRSESRGIPRSHYC